MSADLTISACLIVKNEENSLAACLDSIKDVVDEIVIVDTGSEDKTLSVAESYGAKIFNYEWSNNFSSARNFALQQTTGSWIVNLDATHILKISPETDLNKILDQSKNYGYIIHEQVYHHGKNDIHLDRLLLFRNFLGFRFNGVIFEQADESILNYTNKHWIKDPIGILNGIYVEKHSNKDLKENDERNRIILKDAINNDPENYYHFFMLLLTLRNLGKKDEYKEVLLKAIYRIEQKNPPLNESIVGIWGLFGDWVIEGDNTEKLEKFYTNAATINKKTRWNDIRIVWPYVKVSIMQKKYDAAIDDLTQCLKNGLAPKHITLTKTDRITPAYQLIKLINSTKTAQEFIDFILTIDDLLLDAEIGKNEVIEFIKEHDPELFNVLPTDESNGQANIYNNSSVVPKQLLSLCMIMKNESENLGRCLESVKNVVDEIIVVDTGSTDGSIAIAEQFKAKIFSEDWCDDFSKARNTALEKASGKWIIQLDADEQMAPSSARLLRDQLQDNSADALNITIRNFQPDNDMLDYLDEPQVRLFRNRKNYRYINSVHEQIIPAIAASGGRFSDSNLIINHYGYQTNNKNRAERNLPILNKEIRENPENGYILFKLGETYKALNQWDKAADFLRQALNSSSKNINNELKEIIYLRLGQIELARNNFEDAKKYAQGSLRFNSKSAMAKYILAISMMYEGQFQEAMQIFLELKVTQKLHKLDLSELDKLLEAIEEVKDPETLN